MLISGEEGKGTTLGMTLLVGSVCSLVFAPLFGALSDISRHEAVRFGLVWFGLVVALLSAISLPFPLSPSLSVHLF